MLIKFGILSIATNNYLEYWENFILSAKKELVDFESYTFYLFTDDVQAANLFCSANDIYNVHTEVIPNYKWPEATLFRFKVFHQYRQLFQEDVLIYIDADMLIIGDFQDLLHPYLESHDLAFVRHPGFWRPPKFAKRIVFYLKHPKIFLQDLVKFLIVGGIGTWETREISTAYVSRWQRRFYFCGGFWFGKQEQFLQMCEVLNQRIDADYESGVIAKWHDESHLNYWAANHEIRSVEPIFCFVPQYPQLRGLPEYVRAVDK